MAEKRVKIKITRSTFVAGDFAKKDSELTVGESDARRLFALGKAVPAGDQKKAGRPVKTKAKPGDE